jgi:hypothetical protein
MEHFQDRRCPLNVYTLRADVNNYRGIYYVNSDDVVEFNRRFDGRSLKKLWTGREEFKFVPETLPRTDFPGLSTHIPVFSYKAVEALSDLLGDNGELFPITCDGEEYLLFNVTRIVDALDEANSDIERFSDGHIMDVNRYAFYPQRLFKANVFKIPQAVLMDVFVTDRFADKVKTAGLRGFEFRLAWSSD